MFDPIKGKEIDRTYTFCTQDTIASMALYESSAFWPGKEEKLFTLQRNDILHNPKLFVLMSSGLIVEMAIDADGRRLSRDVMYRGRPLTKIKGGKPRFSSVAMSLAVSSRYIATAEWDFSSKEGAIGVSKRTPFCWIHAEKTPPEEGPVRSTFMLERLGYSILVVCLEQCSVLTRLVTPRSLHPLGSLFRAGEGKIIGAIPVLVGCKVNILLIGREFINKVQMSL